MGSEMCIRDRYNAVNIINFIFIVEAKLLASLNGDILLPYYDSDWRAGMEYGQ